MPLTSAEKDQKISETHDTVVRMEAFLKAHVDNSVIHQVPPCEPHRSLVAKMWGAVLVSLAALYAALTK
jgi:hypothetical protein